MTTSGYGQTWGCWLRLLSQHETTVMTRGFVIDNARLLTVMSHDCQGWVQLHKITTITITLKYQLQLQLQLHHHNIIINYNYTMFISITITIRAPFFKHKVHFYLWNCELIGFGCFPYLACCLVPTQPRNALRLHNIGTSDGISCVGQLN